MNGEKILIQLTFEVSGLTNAISFLDWIVKLVKEQRSDVKIVKVRIPSEREFRKK